MRVTGQRWWVRGAGRTRVQCERASPAEFGVGASWPVGFTPAGKQHDPAAAFGVGDGAGNGGRRLMTVQQLRGFSLPAEGELVAVDVDGTAVAVTVLDGEVHAFDDTCPHAGCSLADGELDEQDVVCPCHFARFDITTGAVVEGSAKSGVGIWSATFTAGTLELEGPRAEAPAPEVSSPPAPGSSATSISGPDRDITVLIEREHESFRRQFDMLPGLTDSQELEQAWEALVDLLEIHASGEEFVLYPSVVHAAEHAAQEAEHGVRDHNEIRDSVRVVQERTVGSAPWWQAVRTVQAVNEQHLQEEERDVLPSLRDNTDRERREALGQQWLTFHADHEGARGLSGKDANPQAVVDRPAEL